MINLTFVVISVYYKSSCPLLVGEKTHPFSSEAVLSAFQDLAQLPSLLPSPHQATLIFAVFMLSFLVSLLLSPSWSVSLLNRYCSSGSLNNSLEILFHMICRLHSFLYRMICAFFFSYRDAIVLSTPVQLVIHSYRTATQPCSVLVQLIVSA